MMGMQIAPAQLFYDFCLDDHVAADHLLRRIDHFLDLDSVRSQLEPFYSYKISRKTYWRAPTAIVRSPPYTRAIDCRLLSHESHFARPPRFAPKKERGCQRRRPLQVATRVGATGDFRTSQLGHASRREP
jgi:hypothetical protein